jgi:transitional endoplasmic reticulum ATPase
MVDPALMRPGRIDRILYIPIPDLEARRSIIEIHTKTKPISEDIDLENLAEMMEGYTGADIAAVCSAASIVAINEHLAKYNDPIEAKEHKAELIISQSHFRDAFLKVKSSSYQKATIYWDQKNPSHNIIA